MVSFRGLSAAALLALATGVNAACSSAQICGNVIPDKSSDDLYVQITAPTAAGWAGFGFGSRMSGSRIFVIYSSADGKNVTLSPRLGKGNIEPQYDDSVNFEILEGTGIEDGKWVMNFVCHNCREWDGGSIDVTSDDELFIFARGGGDGVSSDQPDAEIYQHVTRGNLNIDLASATVAVQGNPFLDDNSNSDNKNNTDTGSDNTGSDDTDSDDSSNDTKSDDSGNGGSSAPMTKADKTLLAHGLIMAISWLFLLPLGATFIRFLGNTFPRPVPLYLHASIQFITFLLAIVGFSLGINTSSQNRTHFKSDHQRLGVAVMILFLLQIPMGYIHHVNFVATGSRSVWSHAHIWNGRIMILLGIVNGGLGLDLAGVKKTDAFGIVIGKVDKKWVVAYAVVAGIVGLMYVGGLVGKALLGEGNKQGREGKGAGMELKSSSVQGSPDERDSLQGRHQYA